MADSSHVALLARAEARLPLTGRLELSQVHAERPTDWSDAPGPLVGLPRRVPRDHDVMVRGHREPEQQDR